MTDDRLSRMLLEADPDRFLAAVHSPARLRPALTALFALDITMGGIVAATKEVGLGQIRLAWWREALQHLDRAPPPGEPVLQALHDHVLPLGVSGSALAGMEEGWVALLLAPSLDDRAALGEHAAMRGGRLFTLAAQILGGGTDAARAGEGWALADLSHRLSDDAGKAAARAMAAERLSGWRIPAGAGAARGLFALAAMARDDVSSADRPRRFGPRRQLHFLRYRLIGR